MSRVLILGGAGFLGGHLARHLLATKVSRLDLVDNLARGVEDEFLRTIRADPRVHFRNVDVLNSDALDDLPVDYDMVYQLAAVVGVKHVLRHPYNALTQNVSIHANAVALAQRQRALQRFVFASTSEVVAGSLEHGGIPFPTPENVSLTITDVAHPRTSYMLSKIVGEAMCQFAGIPFTIVRPHNVYGPRMGLSHVIPELMRKARDLPEGGTLAVASIAHRRAFCYVDDATHMLAKLAENPEALGGTFNIGNETEEISMGELAERIVTTVGRPDLSIVDAPVTPGSPPRRVPDMSRTIAACGVRPEVDLGEGCRRVWSWYDRFVFSSKQPSAV